jgi:hypothetical protein
MVTGKCSDGLSHVFNTDPGGYGIFRAGKQAIGSHCKFGNDMQFPDIDHAIQQDHRFGLGNQFTD